MMEAPDEVLDDRMETSITGSTGGQSSRPGASSKATATRMVTSKFMQGAAASGVAASHQKRELFGREAFQLRGGSTMGPLTTPGTGLHVGRSINLSSTVKASAVYTGRNGPRESNVYGATPSMSMAASLTAESTMLPLNMSAAMDSAAQEKLRQDLLRYQQAKRAEKGGSAGVATGAGARVPALRLDNQSDGPKSARAGGVYSGSGGTNAPTGAPPLSARGSRAPASGRPPASAAAAASGRAAGNGNGAVAAKHPPARLTVATLGGMRVAEQQLRAAVNVPLPRDDVWEASQAPLPGEGPEDAAPHAAPKTPSSRITKSPRVTMPPPGGVAAWPGNNAAALMPPPPPPQQQQQQQQQQVVPLRSPQPAVSTRGGPGTTAGAGGADNIGSRLTSNTEASTSDAGGRSLKDQIKMAKLQELQWRVLKAKVEAAARARIDKGQRQLAACSMLLADMTAHNASVHAALASADSLKHTRHVLAEQLPLLEKWHNLQGTHQPATREVLTALQNAMTSLPLVNGAALGVSGDTAQALMQLRRALANGLGSLQSAEAALAMLLQGNASRVSAGGGAGAAADVRGAAQPSQSNQGGGVPAMAALLPEMHKLLVAEVESLRELLSNLNTLAAKLDETACLRARTVAVGSAAGAKGGSGDAAMAMPWGLDQGQGLPLLLAAAKRGDVLGGDVAPVGDVDALMRDPMVLDRTLAMLGLGVG